MKKIIFKTSCLVLLSGTAFSADITGQGFLKTQGGDVKTCAGNEVYLEKFNSEKNWTYQQVLFYAHDKAIGRNASIEMARIMGNPKGNEKLSDVIKPAYDYRTLDDSLAKRTQCDATGNFEFTNIEEGKYIVATTVKWKVKFTEGGYVYKIIDVNQPKQKILLTE